MEIPHFDIGGIGRPLHFLHANGYPPECYKPLLELLNAEYQVFGMLLRPLWPNSEPEELKSWHPLSEDLLALLAERAAEPVIGVGHSIGAIVTLRAALRDSGKFKALVLIDPVFFVPLRLILWKSFRAIGMGERTHPLITGAKRRRWKFDNLESVFTGYRSRSIFRYFTDKNLRKYIEGITRKTNDGYELVYSPEWEAQIYRTGLQDFDIWRGLPKLNVPTLIIRGAETDTFLEDAAGLVERKQPQVRIETLPRSTHLVPLEYPKEVFEIMRLFLREVS